MTRENYRGAPEFLKFYYENFKNFYAVFFSCYKGENKRFVFDEKSIHELFNIYVPQINILTENHNDLETKFLFHQSHNQKTFVQGTRFPENRNLPCYLQLSEICINEDGDLWNCSHLFRDKVSSTGINIANMHLKDAFKLAKEQVKSFPVDQKCLYGCNKKLINFNYAVSKQLAII